MTHGENRKHLDASEKQALRPNRTTKERIEGAHKPNGKNRKIDNIVIDDWFNVKPIKFDMSMFYRVYAFHMEVNICCHDIIYEKKLKMGV